MSDQIESTTVDTSILFTPVDLGGCTVANRIAMAPMTRNFAQDGVLAESAIGYYRRRAEGGAGLILTEGIATSDIGAHTATVPHLTPGPAADMWRRVNDDVHAVGGKIMAQLWHTGLGRMREFAADPEQPSIGPVAEYLPADTPLAAGGIHPPGRAMSQADIDATIEEYAAAAANAQAAGFDGIELHAAHGYLIDQFFWSQSNRRTDGYGGDLAQRTRFAVEIIQEIRRRVGPSFPIGLRFSQWKLPEHYTVRTLADPAELEVMLTPLTEAGVDFYDASTRRYWETEFDTELTLAGWTKKITARHVIMVGSVGLVGPLDTAHMDVAVRPEANLGRVVAMIETGRADLVGVGRAMLSNPDWGNKVRAGDYAALVPYDVQALASHW
jgi:2,4-dienoyl-CoA reductase-like NADH-dependent reductase (Old Yellow Enzyme family)